MLKVLEARDERVAMTVLEDDASALVQTVEVLDGGNDGVGRIMRVDVDSHR